LDRRLGGPQSRSGRGGEEKFVKRNVKCNQIDIMHHCNQQDMESCDVQLESKFSIIYVVAPPGDFELFLNKLESISNYLYKPKAEFVICGDINVNYVIKIYHK
jgi:hypothetical protein